MEEKGYAPPPGNQPPVVQQPGAPPNYGQNTQQYGYNMEPMAGYSQPGQPMANYGQPGQPMANYGQPGQPMPNYGQPGQPGMPPPPPGAHVAPVVAPQVPMPEPIPGVPSGLEYLFSVDQLLIHQQMELLEILTSWETSNKYVIKNSVGQQVYYCAEESNLCMRQCCGPNRGFTLHITDNFGNEVIRVIRDFKCCAGCSCCAFSDCCAFEIRVEAPVGTVAGYVKQEMHECRPGEMLARAAFMHCADKCSFIKPNLAILDADHQPVLRVTGPLCQCQCICCPRDLPFDIHNYDGTSEVGSITKQWGGVLREMVADADMFGIKFPADLDVRIKATCLGAVFLVDFMYFETQQNKNN